MKNFFCFIFYIFLLSLFIGCGSEKNLSSRNYNSKSSSKNDYSDQNMVDCYKFKNSIRDNSTIDNSHVDNSTVLNSYIINCNRLNWCITVNFFFFFKNFSFFGNIRLIVF